MTLRKALEDALFQFELDMDREIDVLLKENEQEIEEFIDSVVEEIAHELNVTLGDIKK
jgi:hypothetical protein